MDKIVDKHLFTGYLRTKIQKLRNNLIELKRLYSVGLQIYLLKIIFRAIIIMRNPNNFLIIASGI